MIVYQSTKEGFLNDVLNNHIDSKIKDAFIAHLGRTTSPNEILSWTNSMMHMNNVLNDIEIAANAKVSIEFQLPLTSRRIDFIITGLDELYKQNVVIIELKQWSSSKMTNLSSMVITRFQHGESITSHPSYQAWSYAAYLESFSEVIRKEEIKLWPCAYLHNYNNDNIITNQFYDSDIAKAPLFLRSDALKLREFIKRFIKYGDEKDILFKIENGRLRPSKQLADSVSSMLKGKEEFILLDDQKMVFEYALNLALQAKPDKKQVLIVEGGPGTGKSVLAINILSSLLNKGLMVRYVSKNSAPRDVYAAKLTGSFKKSYINNLFGGTGEYFDCKENQFDALIVDEAHRLNLKSGMFQNKGDNQVKELIDASKFTIFFIDNDQKIHFKDIGETQYIEQIALKKGAFVKKLKLESQFRCNGSDGYLAWLDNTLQIRNTANFLLSREEFDFRIFDNPNDLFNAISEKNKFNNKSRLVAGYCWDWMSKNDDTAFDVIIPEFDFKKKWNLSEDGSKWIIGDNTINEVGCIHTCQGLELDYVGVIVGNDLSFSNGKIVTDFSKRSKNDSSVKGLKSLILKSHDEGLSIADRIIKNTYRTLMTRGMKGCFVYFCDNHLKEHFTKNLKLQENTSNYKEIIEVKSKPKFRIEREVNDNVKFIDYLPLYSIRAACGAFSEGQNIDAEGWIKVEGKGRLNRQMFVVRAQGKSMEPKIPDGSLCVFRFNVVGSRNNKIVLVQHHSIFDPDNFGNYTIKIYSSEKKYDKETGEWSHEKIILKPINSEFDPIIIEEDDNFLVVGEFLGIVPL